MRGDPIGLATSWEPNAKKADSDSNREDHRRRVETKREWIIKWNRHKMGMGGGNWLLRQWLAIRKEEAFNIRKNGTDEFQCNNSRNCVNAVSGVQWRGRIMFLRSSRI